MRHRGKKKNISLEGAVSPTTHADDVASVFPPPSPGPLALWPLRGDKKKKTQEEEAKGEKWTESGRSASVVHPRANRNPGRKEGRQQAKV
ncbi:hypothetical protein L596_011953 [Steinernema carpocapsae]|uniref:Uncharacterized protein n=1 Tax=Steinernema carpocapsae TaxID=34508 RepID=A0A4U5NVK1_STECR|nr:hypothetical protein L596_011953 [Steinernema carpocapsae]